MNWPNFLSQLLFQTILVANWIWPFVQFGNKLIKCKIRHLLFNFVKLILDFMNLFGRSVPNFPRSHWIISSLFGYHILRFPTTSCEQMNSIKTFSDWSRTKSIILRNQSGRKGTVNYERYETRGGGSQSPSYDTPNGLWSEKFCDLQWFNPG